MYYVILNSTCSWHPPTITPPSPKNQSTKHGLGLEKILLIVLGGVGGIVVLVGIGFGLNWWRRRRSKRGPYHTPWNDEVVVEEQSEGNSTGRGNADDEEEEEELHAPPAKGQ
eukprot:NODE_691_length_669_cov_416.511070_g682_i0.p1 GENE.NODE_691_length_669_cov_416.511070_g682_i0~~NODE_691_length_669_cov_416.511070_g682_i0.p1  ORF type:complete len:112 (-),score=33.34 NODE_691_length_669_cov_416.511070_g682_i0:181-516(-)